MSSPRDDDALRWDGDDDPTLDVVSAPERTPQAEPAEPTALPHGFNAVGKGSAEVGRVHEDGSVTMPGDRQPMGNAMLITLGILGGIYLLYAIGWVIGGLRLGERSEDPLAGAMSQGSLWLAVLAPLLWFGTVFLLTVRSKSWVRIVWLVAGVALLLPWPFVMIGAVGQ